MDDELSSVDLFCGAGGLSLGFERVGFETLAASDIHSDPCDTFANNIGVDPVVSDIVDLTAEDLMENGGFDSSDVDVIIGGPPCKGFSLAGERDPDDPRNKLWQEYLRIVEDLTPSAVVIENVKGILSMKDGKYKDQILTELRNLGYNTHFSVLNAADYGVPQNRKRVLFVGSKTDKKIGFPEPTHHSHTSGQQRLTSMGSTEPHVTIGDAISDLAFLGPGESSDEYQKPPQTEYQERMRRDSDGLQNHVAPNHSERIQERFSLLDQGKGMESLPPEHQTAKQRMEKFHPKQLSDTITTLPEDFVHYNQNRIPTVRELARIQSFPDDHVFAGPRTTGGLRRRNSVPQYSQVGNAVPPLLAEAVAREVKKTLSENRRPQRQ